MKFKVLLIGILMLGLALGVAAVGSGTDVDNSHLIQIISPAVVSVQALIDPEEGTWSSASGFIVDPTGKVVTACHAVLGATEVTVELQDGISYEATVERCSDDDVEAKLFDVAILQLQGVSGYLPQDWLGDSDNVNLGEEIMVLSYPGPYGEFNVVRGEISGRLPRQYLTLGNEVYRAALLAQFEISWERASEGSLEDIGDLIDLDSSHPSLADLARFAQKDTFVLGVREPLEDDVFCGLVSNVSGEEIEVDGIDCEELVDWLWVKKTGETAKLNREVEFLKTSAPINGGSSGGPVFNLSGQVIGIVSWGRGIEIEEDWLGYIEEVHSWAGTNFIVPAAAIQTTLAGS